jgi:hypothetical protein
MLRVLLGGCGVLPDLPAGSTTAGVRSIYARTPDVESAREGPDKGFSVRR